METPKKIKQLVQEAHNYEFSTNVPIKVYLRTANTLLKHANLYKDGKSYPDAYILYLRFLDLVMNKISNYPNLKKDPLVYKQYQSLVNSKAQIVLSSAEKVRTFIEEEIKSYENYLKIQKKQKELELKKKKLQEQQANNKNITAVSKEKEKETEADNLQKKKIKESFSAVKDVYEFDESRFDQNIQKLRSYSNEPKHRLSASYPSLSRHEKLSTSLDMIPLVPSVPSLPPKISDERPSSSVKPFPELPAKIPVLLARPPMEESTKKVIEHKSTVKTEGGKNLKTVYMPQELKGTFLKIAERNTNRKLETCGILCGKLSLNAFFITTLLIPEQDSTANTCQTKNEEQMFDYMDKNDLFVLGWIHTHPTQTCFLSSVDLHTQNSYQIMLPEAMAIVCAPKYPENNFGIFRLTDPPGISIITNCQRTGFHPHKEDNIYKKCDKSYQGHVVLKSGLPFEYVDLRKVL